MNKRKINIHWFRKGLRLHDNPSLNYAINFKSDSSQILPLFIIDPNFQNVNKVGKNRMSFMLECLQDLYIQFKQLGLEMFIASGTPNDVFEKLFQSQNVQLLTYESDTEPYAINRDKSLNIIANKQNVEVKTQSTHTLFDLNDLQSKNGSKVPGNQQGFLKLIDGLKPNKPETLNLNKNIEKFTMKITNEKDENYIHFFKNVPDLNFFEKQKDLKVTKILVGGETKSLEILSKQMKDEKKVANFEKPKTNPTSLIPETTTLSPYIKFGCLSSRTFFYKTEEIQKKYKNHSTPPESLHGQFYFREYFQLASQFNPNFDKMIDNSLCKQINWDSNFKYLQAWDEGRTGFPAIDATMRQLKDEGWIHHLGRHLVACFLTRGDLWVHWELGARVFEKQLLDADWALNNANWQWLSASRFFYTYQRVYSPIVFQQKQDKSGGQVRKYVKELKDVPDKHIYSPWNMSTDEQRKAGCIIGIDYPKPIVMHDEAKDANLVKIKNAQDNQATITSKDQRLSRNIDDVQKEQVEWKEGIDPIIEEKGVEKSTRDDLIQNRVDQINKDVVNSDQLKSSRLDDAESKKEMKRKRKIDNFRANN